VRELLFVVVAILVGVSSVDDPSLFTDITKTSGIAFRHDPLPADGVMRFLMPEIMGSGGAFLDHDGDGDLDVYLIQGAALDADGKVVEDPSRVNRLFRQDDGLFRDVTDASGLGDPGFGMGVAVGDIDNDGRVDVYVTNYGNDALYRNVGDGRFENVTTSAGIAGEAWSASAVFCDYDADGFLDLYVTHYLDYDPDKPCFKHDGSRDFCGPQEFPGMADTLYRNGGDGSFVDVSRQTRIDRVAAPGLGVTCLDLNADGRLDFYVANDGKANQLWINQAGERFEDEGYMLGVALNTFGKEEAGMGIGPGDVDNDGDIDLFVTHLRDETNTLYRNDGPLGFQDATHQAGLGTAGIKSTGFGTAALDFDHDGYLDFIVVNGRVAYGPPLAATDVDERWRPYAEPNVVLRNNATSGKTGFEAIAIGFEVAVEVSRGLAAGDVDSDGDLDLLVSNAGGPARLLRNDAPKSGRWLLVRAFDPQTRRDAHGAVVTVTLGENRFVRLAQPGQSYLSSGDPRAHFGLPADGAIEALTVTWPDGTTETFEAPEANRMLVVRKGEGIAK
jgi:hypothetical protein